ncbi:hypothetical protein TWF506_001943 [Arthrobotrys conoides]|uniref:Uncharacterized protein n=1 Tax=Arthrobotrys conoides TaxID=74498 RepID=A0AAN8NPF1_9PEZI
MLEFSLALVVYAVSYLKFFVDPSYIEQKLSTEFQARQMEGTGTNALTASEEAALLYVNELRRQQEENLASGRPCFKPSRFYQPFYACVESTGYEAELQVNAAQVPDQPSVPDPDIYDHVVDEDDEDRRRYEEQVARQMRVHREEITVSRNLPPPQAAPQKTQDQAPPPPPPVPKVPVQVPPNVEIQAAPPVPARVQVASNPVPDVRPIPLRVRPPTPEEYGYGVPDEYYMRDPTAMMEDCDEFEMGVPGQRGMDNSYAYGAAQE